MLKDQRNESWQGGNNKYNLRNNERRIHNNGNWRQRENDDRAWSQDNESSRNADNNERASLARKSHSNVRSLQLLDLPQNIISFHAT